MINERIKSLRTQKGITQATLASELGIAKTTLAAYEQGKNEPSNETILKLANYFNVSTDYLLGNSNYKNIQEEINFKNAVVFSEEKDLLELFQRITSCYQFLKELYKNFNTRSSTSPLFRQLIRHLEIITSAYADIDLCRPESIEEIGHQIGSFFYFIDTNFESMKLGQELAHLYQCMINPPTNE